MSIVIVGGNDCMAGRYQQMCEARNCKAKVFTQPQGIKNQMGRPDLVVFFTNTVSHKMIHTAQAALPKNAEIVRCHSSSASALKKILDQYAV